MMVSGTFAIWSWPPLGAVGLSRYTHMLEALPAQYLDAIRPEVSEALIFVEDGVAHALARAIGLPALLDAGASNVLPLGAAADDGADATSAVVVPATLDETERVAVERFADNRGPIRREPRFPLHPRPNT